MSSGVLELFYGHFKLNRRSLTEVLDEITDNKDLKAVFAYNFGDFGSAPQDTTFCMMAALLNHFMNGGYYPIGGASEIAFHIIPSIEANGGRVLVRAPVSSILVDASGRAVGVRVSKGPEGVDVFAPLIISNAGALNTFQRLLPAEVAKNSRIGRAVQHLKPSAGNLSLFVGLRGTKEELGLKAHNIWAFTVNDLDQMMTDWSEMSLQDASVSEIPLLFLSFPSAKDPTFNDRFPGKSTCAVITFCPYSWFEAWEDARVKKRGDEYDGYKKALGDRMWQQVLAIYPQLADKVEYFEVGTPLSNNYYLGATQGEIYGLAHDKKRLSSEMEVLLRPETDIPGLYLTGQDVLSCGYTGALFGGLLCAVSVLNRNVMNDMLTLRRQMKKTK